MPVVPDRWNDDKMDALAAEVALTREQLREHREETREELHKLRRDTKAGFERLDDRLDRLQRAAIQAAVGLASSMVLGFATVVAAVLFTT